MRELVNIQTNNSNFKIFSKKQKKQSNFEKKEEGKRRKPKGEADDLRA
jgi:hypothetical protein